MGADSELRPIYQGCRALTFALARLSCMFRAQLCMFTVVALVDSFNKMLVCFQ